MEITAKAPRKQCISDGCRTITIKTDDPEQQKFLTALHDFFVRGGEAVIKPKNTPMTILVAKGFGYFNEPTTTDEPNNKAPRPQPRIRRIRPT